MNLLYTIILGIGLAMDAFAVSVTSGISIKNMKLHHAFKIALTFSIFQALMPVLGWFMGAMTRNYLSAIDHWIAFGLLSIIGVKMIVEAVKVDEKVEQETNPLNAYILFLLAVATSIDALVVGVTLSVVDISIVLPVIIIGVVTFIMSFFGVYLGNRFGHFFNAAKLEIAGGIILIALGLKILITHLFFQ